MKWFIWKQIGNEVMYFVDSASFWTFSESIRTEYTDFDEALRTAQLLDAYISRVREQ